MGWDNSQLWPVNSQKSRNNSHWFKDNSQILIIIATIQYLIAECQIVIMKQ